jgi:hypothetical protein
VAKPGESFVDGVTPVIWSIVQRRAEEDMDE